MKTLMVGFLFLMVLVSSAHARESEECKQWGNAWRALYDGKIASKTLTPAVAIDLLKHYPGPIGMPEIGMDPKETPRAELDRVYTESGSCAILIFYEIEKYLQGTKLTSAQKKQTLQLTYSELKKEKELRAGLIPLLLRLRSLEEMSNHDWMKLSDAAYFELSRLSGEAKKLANEFRVSPGLVCAEIKEQCKDEEIKSDLRHLKFQNNETNRIYEETIRWVTRVQGKTNS